MREQGSMRSVVTSRSAQAPRFSTPALVVVGLPLFVSGLFVLAAAGTGYPWLMYFFLLASAVLLSLPLLLVTIVVAASETMIGQAWANGLRRLDPPQRGLAGTAERALRYAAVLWLANGAALWLATVVAQF